MLVELIDEPFLGVGERRARGRIQVVHRERRVVLSPGGSLEPRMRKVGVMRPGLRHRGAVDLGEVELEIARGVHGHERGDLRGVANQGLGNQLELRLEDQSEVRFLIEVVVAATGVDDLAGAGRAHHVDGRQAGGTRTAGLAAAAASVLHGLNRFEVALELGLLVRQIAERALQGLDLGCRQRQQRIAKLGLGISAWRGRGAAEQCVGGCGRALLWFDRGAVPKQLAVVVEVRRLMCAGAEHERFDAQAVRDDVLERGAGRSVVGRPGEAGQARERARVGRAAQVLEALVHVHGRVVLLERPENAQVGLVEREARAVAVRDLRVVVLDRNPMRDVHQEEALGCAARCSAGSAREARGGGQGEAQRQSLEEHAALQTTLGAQQAEVLGHRGEK